MQNRDGLGIQIVANGVVLQEHTKDGKTYVAAPWNTDYQLRLVTPLIRGNRHEYKRYLAVVSVDGLDVKTGETATADAGGGYIITPPTRPNANDLPGFRLNKKEVAAFRFGDRTDSYASLLGKPANVGVIGVVFYSELDSKPEVYVSKGSFGGGSRSSGGGSTTRGGHDMGTEFGSRKEFVTFTDTFDKDREIARMVLEYASYDSLKLAGIITESGLGSVNAFPADSGCAPPSGWQG